ncbi:MAG: SUF system Fe-S cluster assembly regulator [Gammaproteobacteria bacterium]|nr:SUF system Fe-S cluster assembly regulator [Gammaproteobacteria bacterium]
MLRLSKLTDYGVLLMTHMAASDSGTYSAVALAEATRVPLPTVSKVLKLLSRQRLVESIRGPRGGYRLARSPARITVGEIVRCLEGGIALTECSRDDAECEQAPFCVSGNGWKRINAAVRDALGTISLADMAEPDFMPFFRLQRTIQVTEELS